MLSRNSTTERWHIQTLSTSQEMLWRRSRAFGQCFINNDTRKDRSRIRAICRAQVTRPHTIEVRVVRAISNALPPQAHMKKSNEGSNNVTSTGCSVHLRLVCRWRTACGSTLTRRLEAYASQSCAASPQTRKSHIRLRGGEIRLLACGPSVNLKRTLLARTTQVAPSHPPHPSRLERPTCTIISPAGGFHGC